MPHGALIEARLMADEIEAQIEEAANMGEPPSFVLMRHQADWLVAFLRKAQQDAAPQAIQTGSEAGRLRPPIEPNGEPAVAASKQYVPQEYIQASAELSQLVELKKIKRLMEAGTATLEQRSYYERSKESAWRDAERAIDNVRAFTNVWQVLALPE